MATKGPVNFTSWAVFDVTESAANTLTYDKLETGLSAYDRTGWIMQRLEFFQPFANYGTLNATQDYIQFGLAMSNAPTAIDNANPVFYSVASMGRVDLGTAASGMFAMNPMVLDFSGLSGEGILMLPNPLYCAIQSAGATAANRIIMKLYYKSVELSDSDYTNLLQARQMLITA